MQNDQEFSETPNGDAAEEFLNSPNGQESEPSLLQKEVLRLYAQAESIKELLQEAVLQENPLLLDNFLLRDKYGISLGLTKSNKLLANIEKGEVDLSYWIDRSREEDIDPEEPRIMLEGEEIVGITLQNDYSASYIHPGKQFQEEHSYEIGLMSLPLHVPEDSEEGYIVQQFYISDKGNWKKLRETDIDDEEDKTSFEITPYDLEIAGTALTILKARLTKALASSKQDQ